MKKIALTLFMVLCYASVWAAQTTLNETIDDTLDPALTNSGKDVRLTNQANAVKQNLMNTELYEKDASQDVTIDGKQVELTEGSFVDGDKNKLDGIETGATADQDLSGYVPTTGMTTVSADVTTMLGLSDKASIQAWLGITDPVASYSLTGAFTDATGTGSTFTVNSESATVADSPKTWVGLTSATEAITFTPNTTETSSCTGTGVTGSSPNWVVDMSSADVTDLACTVSAAGATLISDDFEGVDGTDITTYSASWIADGTDPGDTMEIDTAQSTGTGASSVIMSSTATSDAFVCRQFTQQTTGTFTIEYDFRVETTPSTTNQLGFLNEGVYNWDTSFAWFLTSSGNGDIVSYADSNTILTNVVLGDTWYHIEIEVDLDANTGDFWFDALAGDAADVTGVALDNNISPDRFCMVVDATATDSYWIDNLEIYEGSRE